VSLYKRGRTFWTYLWVDGVRHAKSTGTAHRREAQDIEREFRQELNRKRHQLVQPMPEMTFGALAARFLADRPPLPHHLDRLKVLLPYFADYPIGRITKALVRSYRTRRHSEKRLSETTLNRDIEVLRHLLYWAVDEGLLTANPIARIPMVRERRKPRPIMGLAEEAKLLEAAAPHLQPILIMALDTGMRRGELLTQCFEHVDLNRRVLSVTHSKTAEGEAREIPLTARLCDLLSSHGKGDGLVLTFEGRPLHKIKTAWKTAIRRAGIRSFRFHDLRHTFNTRLMEAGVMSDVRKALMGHSSGEDVHAIYTHVELPMKREAIRKLEAWIAVQRKNQEPTNDGDEHAKPEPIHDGRHDRSDPPGLPSAGGEHPEETHGGDRVPSR
jgi:integrase